LFYYGKATALYHIGQYDKVIHTLESALALQPVEPDDVVRKQRCKNLLQESRQRFAKA
jgi:hypothetical protein